MDMIDSVSPQQHRVIRPQPGVQQGFQSAFRRFLPSQKHSARQIGNPFPAPNYQPESSQKSQYSDWLQAEQLRLKRSIARSALCRVRPSHAAGNDVDSMPLQFLDLFTHIGLDCFRKSISEISDRQHGIRDCEIRGAELRVQN